MTKIDLYGIDMSPFVRAVMVTAKALNIEINLIETSPLTGDTKKPEYIAMNPQHCIPTIKDGDFVLWESRAICAYLANKYGSGTGLYPEDPQKKAWADQMVHFDVGTLFTRFMKFAGPVVFKNEPANSDLRANVDEGLAMLDKMLEGHNFVAGNDVTYADHGMIVSVTSMEACGISVSKFKNIQKWMARCKQWPYYGEVQKGLDGFAGFFKPKLEGHV